jgi:hypothetical protein
MHQKDLPCDNNHLGLWLPEADTKKLNFVNQVPFVHVHH